MSDIVSNDELNTLAAEYVLGTLDYEERKGAAALLEVDPTFRGIVRIWERRFGDLHLMVEAVEPDPQLWVRIKPKMAGVEQIAPAIPSSKVVEEPAAAAAPADAPADAAAAEPTAETVVAEGAAPATAPTTPPTETPPVTATPPAEAKPEEAKPAAIADAELKLAELAALLPVNGAPAGQTPPAEAVPEDGLHTHAPDLVPRGFVPPVPMSTRGAPAVVEKTVHKQGGRGWIAATLMMALIAVALAALISAWRFFPERLPAQLRANQVLNLSTQAQPAPKAAARPKLAPFDE
jgi:anti-sigma-K factor RskA